MNRTVNVSASVLFGLSVAGLAGAAAVAGLESIHVSRQTAMRDGPGMDRSALDMIADGTGASVTACLDDFSWCRVIVGGLPGWMPADRLAFMLDGREVTVSTHGRDLSIPTFDGKSQQIPPTGNGLDEAAPPPGNGSP